MVALNLTNQFLIAMPGLADPNFQKTVTFVCAHSDEGAMGIIINRLSGVGAAGCWRRWTWCRPIPSSAR